MSASYEKIKSSTSLKELTYLEMCIWYQLEENNMDAIRAAKELDDYELRLDLLAKGATWEHEENERLKDEIAALRAKLAETENELSDEEQSRMFAQAVGEQAEVENAALRERVERMEHIERIARDVNTWLKTSAGLKDTAHQRSLEAALARLDNPQICAKIRLCLQIGTNEQKNLGKRKRVGSPR